MQPRNNRRKNWKIKSRKKKVEERIKREKGKKNGRRKMKDIANETREQNTRRKLNLKSERKNRNGCNEDKRQKYLPLRF